MDKTDNKTETKLDKSNRNKEGLPFTDSAIQKWLPSFSERGNPRFIEIPFNIKDIPHLKGLAMRMSRATKVKDFIIRYYFKGPYKRHTLGPFVKGKFGVKQINDRLYEIVKTHKNDKGLWTRDPAITEKEKDTKITKAQLEQSQKKTIREVIVMLCENGFPRAEKDGTLCARSLSSCCRYLIGYNWRTKHLRFLDDQKGNGYVEFTRSFHKRVERPNSWEELFKKYPGQPPFYKTITIKDKDGKKKKRKITIEVVLSRYMMILIMENYL